MAFFKRKKTVSGTVSAETESAGKHAPDVKFVNYARRKNVDSGVHELVDIVLSSKKKSIAGIFLFCLLIISAAGFVRFHFGGLAMKHIEQTNRMASNIDKALESLAKKSQEIIELSSVTVNPPLISQFSVFTAAANKNIALRDIQYDSSIESLQDIFFIETGRDISTIKHGGLWSIDSIVLAPNAVQSFISNLQESARQVLDMNVYATISGGQTRANASSSQLFLIVFWRQS